LTSPSPGESADLCRLRIGLTAALLILHVTQGSKWRLVEVLEQTSLIFYAVRPLALVNDAFILLSAYLCMWGHARAAVTAGGCPTRGTTSLAAECFALMRRCLHRCLGKYLRQLPVILVWHWVYVSFLPNVPYNMYNHTYPWFGVRWFQQTAKCMQFKYRYAFLLGDLGRLLSAQKDPHWRSGNGNPCANLWNFQLEIEVFVAVSCILALPSSMGSAAAAVILAGAATVANRKDDWWIPYHARGVAMLVLSLRAIGLPHAASPPPIWRAARVPGLLLIGLAMLVHGILLGSWFEHTAPALVTAVRSRTAGNPLAYQAPLAFGMVLACEACRAQRVVRRAPPDRAETEDIDGDSTAEAEAVANTVGEAAAEERPPPSSMLTALSRLSFGVNVAHPFVQFYVEAHASVDMRVFSMFSWLTQLFGMMWFSVCVAAVVYVCVQRPWTRPCDSGHRARRPWLPPTCMRHPRPPP